MPDKALQFSYDNRAERYRRLAAETLKLAKDSDAGEIRATYLSLSACWTSLADKADRLSDQD